MGVNVVHMGGRTSGRSALTQTQRRPCGGESVHETSEQLNRIDDGRSTCLPVARVSPIERTHDALWHQMLSALLTTTSGLGDVNNEGKVMRRELRLRDTVWPHNDPFTVRRRACPYWFDS